MGVVTYIALFPCCQVLSEFCPVISGYRAPSGFYDAFYADFCDVFGRRIYDAFSDDFGIYDAIYDAVTARTNVRCTGPDSTVIGLIRSKTEPFRSADK